MSELISLRMLVFAWLLVALSPHATPMWVLVAIMLAGDWIEEWVRE